MGVTPTLRPHLPSPRSLPPHHRLPCSASRLLPTLQVDKICSGALGDDIGARVVWHGGITGAQRRHVLMGTCWQRHGACGCLAQRWCTVGYGWHKHYGPLCLEAWHCMAKASVVSCLGRNLGTADTARLGHRVI